MTEIYPFVVPLVQKVKEGTNLKGRLEVNWELINKVIAYQKEKIYDIVFCRVAKDALLRSIDVERKVKFEQESHINRLKGSIKARDKDMVGIWDDRFTGVRYVKLK